MKRREAPRRNTHRGDASAGSLSANEGRCLQTDTKFHTSLSIRATPRPVILNNLQGPGFAEDVTAALARVYTAEGHLRVQRPSSPTAIFYQLHRKRGSPTSVHSEPFSDVSIWAGLIKETARCRPSAFHWTATRGVFGDVSRCWRRCVLETAAGNCSNV